MKETHTDPQFICTQINLPFNSVFHEVRELPSISKCSRDPQCPCVPPLTTSRAKEIVPLMSWASLLQCLIRTQARNTPVGNSGTQGSNIRSRCRPLFSLACVSHPSGKRPQCTCGHSHFWNLLYAYLSQQYLLSATLYPPPNFTQSNGIFRTKHSRYKLAKLAALKTLWMNSK